MLVLTRKYNQSIMIGDAIEIVVVDIKGDQVKLGIRAPKECTILRAEIHQQIREENALAAAARPEALDGLLGERLPGAAPPAPGAPRKPAIILRKPPETPPKK